MTYRELIAATRQPGPIYVDAMGPNETLQVQVVKTDLRGQLEAKAARAGDRDSETEFDLIDVGYGQILTGTAVR